jgi:hypothetical protein
MCLVVAWKKYAQRQHNLRWEILAEKIKLGPPFFLGANALPSPFLTAVRAVGKWLCPYTRCLAILEMAPGCEEESAGRTAGGRKREEEDGCT